MKKKIAVTQYQGGNEGTVYFVQKSVNVLDPEVGKKLTKEEVALLINQDIEVEITKPK